MADQLFDKKNNRFWIDLHKCSTAEAINVTNKRMEECYNYGINALEIIYGTPDQYAGSIEEAVKNLSKDNPYIKDTDEIHAGIVITIKENSNPLPQNENMVFCGFAGVYENWHRTMEHQYNYYPFRKSFTTDELSKDFGCPVEYIRNLAGNLDNECTELKTVYNQYTSRNETTWYIYRSGYEFIKEKWQQDKEAIMEEFKNLKASDSEIDDVLKSFKTPLTSAQKVKSRASAALKRIRSKSIKKTFK